MYLIQKLNWADKYHPIWLDIIRILFGIVIFAKGIIFIVNQDEVINMIVQSTNEFLSFIIAHYVIASFIVGGIAITIGFFTRTACILQIPAVLGSLILVDYHKNLFALNSLFIYSLLILILLGFFGFFGAGTFSIDNYIKKKSEV